MEEIKIPANVKDKKKYLSNKADKLWFKACQKKWGNECIIGKDFEYEGDKNDGCWGEANQVHHWIKKRQSLATRWDLENGVPVCQPCHYILEHSKDVMKRRAFEEKIINERGQDWVDRLQDKRKQTYKRTITNYQETIKSLEARG